VRRQVRSTKGARLPSQWAVTLLGVSAAFAYALSTSLKHLSAGSGSEPQSLHLRKLTIFIKTTLSHPLWLASIVCDVAGVALQVVALHFGPLTVVQPLLVSGLLFALLLRQRLEHRQLTGSQLGWAIVLTATLCGFLLLAETGHSSTAAAAADHAPAAIAGVVGAILAIGCVELGRRQRKHGRRAALIGVAVGILYASAAALLKALTDIAAKGPIELARSWQLYTVIIVGATGLLLNQLAFQAAPLSASLPAISTVDPLLSIVVGVVVYDEHISRGPGGGAVLIAMLLLMGAAVIQLARTSNETSNDMVTSSPT
jgi:hypothetical protein